MNSSPESGNRSKRTDEDIEEKTEGITVADSI